MSDCVLLLQSCTFLTDQLQPGKPALEAQTVFHLCVFYDHDDSSPIHTTRQHRYDAEKKECVFNESVPLRFDGIHQHVKIVLVLGNDNECIYECYLNLADIGDHMVSALTAIVSFPSVGDTPQEQRVLLDYSISNVGSPSLLGGNRRSKEDNGRVTRRINMLHTMRMRWCILVLIMVILGAIIVTVVVTQLSPSTYQNRYVYNPMTTKPPSSEPWIEFMQPQQGSWTRWTNVTARFGGVAPVPDDWIGVFLSTWPATYVQWFRVLGSNTSVPVSNMTFNLLNSRDGYYARYYRADVLMAQSNVVYPDGSYPTHSRLVLTPEGIRMSWTSNRTTPSSTIARFGMQSDLSDAVTIPAQSSTYTQEDIVRCLGYPNPIPIRTTPFPNIHHHTFTCAKHHHKACTGDDIAARLFFPPGYFHNVTIPLRGLVGGKRYYYAVGELGGYMSNVMSFVCPPDASSDSVSVLYTADVGIGSMEPYETGSAIHNSLNADHGRQVLEHLAANVDTAGDHAWIINGDLSYANGWLWMWERFMDLATPLMSTLPTMVTMGNHELDYLNNTDGAPFANVADSGGECGIPTRTRFHLNPAQGWYAVDVGPIHFVMLNSERNLTVQREWMIADVNGVDRGRTPWVVVCTHRPLYGSYTATPELGKLFIDVFADAFGNLGVDVVMGAHRHYYERMIKIRNVTYIIDGVGGRDDVLLEETAPHPHTLYKEFQKTGYTRIQVSNRTMMTITHFRTDGTVGDTIDLHK